MTVDVLLTEADCCPLTGDRADDRSRQIHTRERRVRVFIPYLTLTPMSDALAENARALDGAHHWDRDPRTGNVRLWDEM